MSDRTTTGEAREALDDLHLAAHENGPTTDMSTHFRRARRLWVTVVGELGGEREAAGGLLQTFAVEPGRPQHLRQHGEPMPAWDGLGASMQLMLIGFGARAVQDVLEVEQVMYRALSAALDLHRISDDARLTGFPRADRVEHYCVADRELWPCSTVTAITTGVEGIMGGGDRG